MRLEGGLDAPPAVLFKMTGGKVYEERWFVDTVQWKAAF